jgi:hypothetical protein
VKKNGMEMKKKYIRAIFLKKKNEEKEEEERVRVEAGIQN